MLELAGGLSASDLYRIRSSWLMISRVFLWLAFTLLTSLSMAYHGMLVFAL